MEFINFSAIPRMSFFAQIYHYFSLDIIWFLLISIILEKYHTNTYIYKVVIYVQNIFELAIIGFAFSIIFNAILNGGINYDAIVAIYQTNFKEAWHYFWGVNHGVILCFLIFTTLIALCFLFIALRGKIWSSLYTPYNKTIHINILLFFITLLLCWGGIMGSMYHLYFNPLTWRTIQFYNIYDSLVTKHQQLMSQRQQLIQEFSTHYNVDNKPNGIGGLFVLIIGESLDRRYMGCYNYKYDTTPFQKNLKNQSEAVFFNNIYACHAQTAKAVPMMLTLYNQYIPMNTPLFSDVELSLSLLDIAKNNGYDVYWISNQEKVSPHNSIISSIASSASQCIFMQEIKTQTNYDHEIIPILKKITFSKRSLVIIHLMGNHYPYGLTFPRDISYPDNLTSGYEKSVYYNDKVIQQITEFFQSHEATLISYVSDHSDAVSIGKIHDPRPSHFNIEMIEIPMWFWVSEDYRKQYPNLYAKLLSSSNKPITNDLVFNMYMDLMQLKFIDKIDKYSPLSDNYILDTEPPKTLDGKLEIPNP
jgi:heptose-I-phosphate ethanolaminephosphotransferase